MEYDIVCGARFPCGFRADAEYFERKPRFTAGYCPRCSGPIRIVEKYTENEVAGLKVETDPRKSSYGEVVPE